MKSGKYDSDDEEEEDILIFAEFENNVNVVNYRSIHVLGVDTKNPVIQLDNTFHTGQYESPVGTHLFFEPDYNAKSEDQLFDKLPDQNLKLFCKTTKYLNMKCAQATPKIGTVLSDKTNEIEDELEAANFNSVQEAVEKLKNAWKPADTAKVDLTILCETNRKDPV